MDEATSITRLAVLVSLVDSGRCPRCAGPREPGVRSAGSRATRCRCTPVCSDCGSDEVHGVMFQEWPDAGLGREQRRQEEEARTIHGELVFEEGVGYLVTDDGVIPLRPRPTKPHGGWSEYGYDESSDGEEKRGR